MIHEDIIHLRRGDFDDDGNLLDDYFTDKIVIVFIYTTFCVYCHEAAPEYNKAYLQDKDKEDVVYAAICANGDVDGELDCEQLFGKLLNNFQGFPDYAILINKKVYFNDEPFQRDSVYINNIVATLQQIK